MESESSFMGLPLSNVFLGTSAWTIHRQLAGKVFSQKNSVILRSEWTRMEEIDAAFSNLMEKEKKAATEHKFAWSKKFGYLAPRLARCGSGLSIDTCIHLEGLFLTCELDVVMNALEAVRLNVTGANIDGVENTGHFFHIENASSFGISEYDMFERTKKALHDLAVCECRARVNLIKRFPHVLDDALRRAIAAFQCARLMSKGETIDLLSPVRLASQMNLIDGVPLSTIEEIITDFISFDAEEEYSGRPDTDIYSIHMRTTKHDAIDEELASRMRELFKPLKITNTGKRLLK